MLRPAEKAQMPLRERIVGMAVSVINEFVCDTTQWLSKGNRRVHHGEMSHTKWEVRRMLASLRAVHAFVMRCSMTDYM
jgi:hypothetical protein